MPSRPRRTPGGLQRVIYTLRTEGGSRSREAWAIGLGLFIGCSPLIGLHLAMCVAAGMLFGLNRLKLYLAANLVNPFVLPAVLFAEVQAGALVTRGAMYPVSLSAFRSLDPWQFGFDLLLGSFIVGGIVGAAGGLAAFVSLGRAYRDPVFTKLVRAAADRYIGTSVTAWEFARAKLRNDPVYRAVLLSGMLPQSGHLVDVGCGQGLLLTLIAEARVFAAAGEWPNDWPPAPVHLQLTGIELRPRPAALARHALGDAAQIHTGDARQMPVDSADVITVFDVLHLIDPAAQEALVARLAAALRSGGVLLVREADAGASWRFQMVRLGNRLTALAQGRFRARLSFRRADEWMALLRAQGLSVDVAAMGEGTPFGNVLLACRKDRRKD
ncbi:MAG TPA: DUF2062 domain-containing protein [Vicinamibacterales bacterium]